MQFPSVIVCTSFTAVAFSLVLCAASAPLSSFGYSFGSGTGDQLLGEADYKEVEFEFPYYGAIQNTTFVHENGLLSFGSAVPDYFTTPFPISGPAVIAPFFTDIETGPGEVYYRETNDTVLLANAASAIQKGFQDFGDFEPTSLFIATWNGVGYFGGNITNTFQCVLATNEILSFALLLYAEIEWATSVPETMTGSEQHVPAQVGFNAGDGERFVSLPGSRTEAILNISSTSNVGEPGMWIFRVDGDIVTSGNIDECATQTDNCHVNAECANTDGSFNCTCVVGYEGDGVTCTDIDECATQTDNCHVNAECANTDGSFNCTCVVGYEGDGVTCTDIDECATQTDNCHANAECTNTDGSFNCTCVVGYEGDGVTCTDIDECATQTDNCHVNAECANTDGSFNCTCVVGYEGDGVTCTDIDECATQTDNCHVNAECANTDGSFNCSCVVGYEGDGVTCTDVDECATQTDNCHVNAECTNTDGSFNCSCIVGYEGDGVTCTDIDECATQTDNCHVNAECTNTDGSFNCSCIVGYEGDGVTCTDIDECATQTDNCHVNAECANTDGSFNCSCVVGYEGDGVTCTDVDECATQTDNCHVNAECANTDGSFNCTCVVGYEGDGVTCTDIDECATQTDNCHVNAECANTDGSFNCSCVVGYEGDGVTCTDIDECATQTDNCHVNAGCTNTDGSFDCDCVFGYDGDGVTCNCYDGRVRLLNGANYSDAEGRVEICYNDTYGTVCDDLWDVLDALVVCHQLGHTSNDSIPFRNASYGSGSGPIFLDNVICQGTETSLLECDTNPIGEHNCDHSEDAGVRCEATCIEGSVRLLVGAGYDYYRGATNYEDFYSNKDQLAMGRVEVCIGGTFGSVCDESWNNEAASVVCKQLGFSQFGAVGFIGNTFTSLSPLPPLLYTVNCTGAEDTLLECIIGTTINTTADIDLTCDPQSYAQVVCQDTETTYANCTNGEVRLADGNDPLEGRVEICINSAWGTVCDDRFGGQEATVICRQLNFTGGVAFQESYFGNGSGPIFLENLICTEAELELLQCRRFTPIGLHSCDHSEDAGVQCEDIDECAVDNGGCDQICQNLLPGFECDCELGYTYNGTSCNNINECEVGNGDCDHVCVDTEGSYYCECLNGTVLALDDRNCTECTLGDVRLANGSSKREGRVEFCADGLFGTVCDDHWDELDALVVCRQLNFSTNGSIPVRNAYYGSGEGLQIATDDVECTGNELALEECLHLNVGEDNCDHSEDAGVRCEVLCVEGNVRLLLGDDYGEGTDYDDANFDKDGLTRGRVEICIDGIYGTVCDDSWDYQDASVVCRQLGFSPYGAIAQTGEIFGEGNAPLLLSQVNCSGSEITLKDCPASIESPGSGYATMPWPFEECGQFQDAGVICQDLSTPQANCTDGDMRLIANSSELEGRVEICINNAWGTVCNEAFGLHEAEVVCGYFGGEDAQSFEVLPGSGPIFLSQVVCAGSESTLLECESHSLHSCDHNQDVSLRCEDIDECETLNGGCGHNCTNTPGSFYCTCNPGYILDTDGLNCTDIPECTLGSHDCHVNAFCIEMIGSYNCSCLDGYDGDGVMNCTNVNECDENPYICDENANCTDSEGNYTCSCNSGYAGNGSYCENIDECESGGHNCDVNAECTDTDGSFDCMCNDIYTGNGTTCICDEGSILLIGGSTTNEGTVLICINNMYGTICDDFWDEHDATVVCRQMGSTQGYAIPFRNSHFTNGTGPILLDDVDCSGSEASLLECGVNPNGVHQCSRDHSEDAGVQCENQVSCIEGDIRLLVDNPGDVVLFDDRLIQGRVEYCYDESYQTLCTDEWSDMDASVVCRELGFSPYGAIAVKSSVFSQSDQPPLAQHVQCTGSEERLRQCTVNTDQDCIRNTDAGVVCQVPSTGNANCTDGELRLGDGANPLEGRVEVCINNAWGTVCDNGFSTDDSEVVCRQSSYPYYNGTEVLHGGFNGSGTGPVFLDQVACNGDETELLQCNTHRPRGVNKCSHFQDVGVRCIDINECLDSNGGCDQLCYNLIPDHVCNCTEGYELDADEHTCNDINECTADMHECHTNATCTNTNGSYTCSCDSGFRGNGFNCTQTCVHGDIQLVPDLIYLDSSGFGPYLINDEIHFGRVEICINHVNGTICDDSWDNEDASVVCRQLGFSPYGAIHLAGGIFSERKLPTVLSDVNCIGNEMRLVDCEALGRSCGALEDAGVVCQDVTIQEGNCTSGDIRIVGKDNATLGIRQGRVEICINNAWGTICQDASFDVVDAGVVCQQLPGGGFYREGAVVQYNGVPGTGPIFLEQVECSIEDTELLNCPIFAPVGISSCVHDQDVSIGCRDINECQVNSSVCNQICENTVGGYKCLCDSGYELDSDGRACNDIDECATGMDNCDDMAICNNTVGSYKCTCIEKYEGNGFKGNCKSCSDGQVRLKNGTEVCPDCTEGIVEICVNKTYGTVCDDFWDALEARVVCSQLGYVSNGSVPLGNSYFGNGSSDLPIFLDNVVCQGTESSLLDCATNPIGVHNCDHSEDAGVRCEATCREGSIRLMLGDTDGYEFYKGDTDYGDAYYLDDILIRGRVEFCFDGQYSSVCTDGWDHGDASVVCRELGFSPYGALGINSEPLGIGPRALITNVQCDGMESSLKECTRRNFIEDEVCGSRQAAVVCQYPLTVASNCFDGELRLVDGANPREGRVEVCINNAWGTVCDTEFSSMEATVICRILGHRPEEADRSRKTFGEGEGPIYLDGLRCTGQESNLLHCEVGRPLGLPDALCDHSDDVGVECPDLNECERDLHNCDSNATCINTVENFDCTCNTGYTGIGTIGNCANINECELDALNNCSVNADCSDTEGDYECTCQHEYSGDGFNCRCTDGQVRLMNGSEPCLNCTEGRVEICYNNTYGTVCDDQWDLLDTRVICNQLLGYTPNDTVPLYNAHDYGNGLGPIFLDNVICQGTESSLLECDTNPIGVHNCDHSEDAGVRCGDVCTDGSLRLLATTSDKDDNEQNDYDKSAFGRVEVCINGTYGTVCNDYWDNEDASVVCRQLGFSPYGAVGGSAVFTETTLPNVLASVNCSGEEDYLLGCSHDNTDRCGVFDDSHVVCQDNSTPEGECDDGEIRFINSQGEISQHEGRVEICINNAWGTICGTLFDVREAMVVCRKAGVVNGAPQLQPFGTGTGPIFLEEVVCEGTETSILDCEHHSRGLGITLCDHSQDAGVQCGARCPQDYEPSISYGNYTWNAIDAEEMLEMPCVYIIEGIPRGMARKHCRSSGEWNPTNFSECPTKLDVELNEIEKIQITQENAGEVIGDVNEIVQGSTIEDQSEKNVEIISMILQESTAFALNEMTLGNIAGMLSGLQQWPSDVLRNYGPRIVESFETVSSNLVLADGFNDQLILGNLTFRGEKVAFSEAITAGSQFTVPGMSAAIALPPELFGSLQNPGQDVRLTYTAYNEASLFPVAALRDAKFNIVSPILGASVAGHEMNNLPTNAHVTIELPLGSRDIEVPSCVFWDFTKNEWSEEGCSMVESSTSETMMTCTCNHLTNFAVLANTDPVDDCNPALEKPSPDFVMCESLTPNITVEVLETIGVTYTLQEEANMTSYYTVGMGHQFGLECTTDTLFTVTWYIDSELVPEVAAPDCESIECCDVTFPTGGVGGQLYAYRVLPNRVILRTRTSTGLDGDCVEIGVQKVASGTYKCVANNSDAENNKTVEIDVTAGQVPSTYVRFSANQTEIQQENRLESNESGITEAFLSTKVLSDLGDLDPAQAVECYEVPRREEDIIQDLSRFECNVTSNSSIEGLILDSAMQYNVSTLGFCDYEVADTAHGCYNWTEVEAGSMETLPCFYMEPADKYTPSSMARRNCDGPRMWTEYDGEECITRITHEFWLLDNMTITPENVGNVTDALADLVLRANSTVDQSPRNLGVVSSVFDDTINLISGGNLSSDDELLTSQAKTVDGITVWPAGVLEEQSSSIVMSFELVAENLVVQENFTNITIQDRKNIAINGVSVKTTALQANGTMMNLTDLIQPDSAVDGDNTTSVTALPAANVQLPPETFENISDPSVGLVFTVYQVGSLFPVESALRDEGFIIGSLVVGASVGEMSVANLSQPVVITLQIDPNKVNYSDVQSTMCVSWDFTANDGRGAWNETGCNTTVEEEGVVVCECDHLTNFALLMDIRAREEGKPEKDVGLEALSYIGASLSLIGLILTIVTLLASKALRGRDVTKFHLQLAMSLIGLLLVFMIGIDRTENEVVCTTMSMLLQYFTLVAVFVMGAQAILMLRKLVLDVFYKITVRFIVAVSLTCWLAPLLFVVVSLFTLATGENTLVFVSEEGEERVLEACFISDIGVLFGTFFVPILLVILFNSVIFVLIVRVLLTQSQKKIKEVKGDNKMMMRSTMKTVLGIIVVMVVFGLTWLFGALTIRGASKAFQYLFVICNAFQGFYFFLFTVIISKEGRDLWKEIVTLGTLKKRSTYTKSTPFSPQHVSAGKVGAQTASTQMESESLPRYDSVSKSASDAKNVEMSTVATNEGTLSKKHLLSEAEESFIEDSHAPEAPNGLTTEVVVSEDETILVNYRAVECNTGAEDAELGIGVTGDEAWDDLQLASKTTLPTKEDDEENHNEDVNPAYDPAISSV